MIPLYSIIASIPLLLAYLYRKEKLMPFDTLTFPRTGVQVREAAAKRAESLRQEAASDEAQLAKLREAKEPEAVGASLAAALLGKNSDDAVRASALAGSVERKRACADDLDRLARNVTGGDAYALTLDDLRALGL